MNAGLGARTEVSLVAGLACFPLPRSPLGSTSSSSFLIFFGVPPDLSGKGPQARSVSSPSFSFSFDSVDKLSHFFRKPLFSRPLPIALRAWRSWTEDGSADSVDCLYGGLTLFHFFFFRSFSFLPSFFFCRCRLCVRQFHSLLLLHPLEPPSSSTTVR